MNHLAFVAYLSLFGADAVTTHQALRLPGAHELYLTQSPLTNDALLTAQAGALWWATSRIKRPALRWTIRLSIAGLHGYAAVHNRQEITRATR
jgi:hypothetical protein